MTCARPRHNATPSKHFPHTSHCALHTSHLHFTLHAHFISSQDHVNSSHLISPHLTSSQLFSSHPISSHMSSKKVLLNCFHLIRALINLSHLLGVVLNSSQLFCMPENSYCQHTEAWDTDALTLYTGKASRKYLCTTKLSSTHLGKTVKHTVSCSGFLPNTSPMQNSCSHYNAFYSTTYTSMQAAITMRFASTRCRTQRRNRLTSKRSKPHLPHTGGTLHRRLQPLYTKKHTVSCSGFLPNTSPTQHSCNHYNAFCSHYNAIRIHLLQNTEEEPIDLETIQTAPAAHRRYPSWPAAANVHGKTHGFVLRLPPQHKPHATFMQPLQCILQHHVHIHAGSHYIAICIHSLQNTEEEPIDLETIQAAPAAHRRYPSSPAAATLHGKTHGFVLPLPLQKQPHATFMQPLQCAFAAPRTHPCSHWNAICIHPLQNTGGTDWPRKNPIRNRRTQEVPFIAGCSHFTLKNTRFCAPASSPKQTPCNIHAASTMRFAVSHHPLLNVFLCDLKPHTTLHECILMWCKASHHPSLSVLLCDVKSHTTLHWVYCYVMSSLTPPFSECIVMWCQVSHHPSLSVLLCDVKSHTTLHWVYCYVMSSLTPPFIECIVMWCQVSHHPSSGKSHA